MTRKRMRPFGADLVEGGVDFVLHAPAWKRATLVLEEGRTVEMSPRGDGAFTCLVPGLKAGVCYRFRESAGERLYPDPASRFQPEGPHGPSMVVDPRAYAWRDREWKGVRIEGQVVYELHVGTFTREGTYAAAAREIPRLAELGITLLEVMPVADFPGRFGWGYDGVNLFAPAHVYGTPDDLRALVDQAHACGVGVILDVVYNHFGPDGHYLPALWPQLMSRENATEWGESIDFDGPESAATRAYYLDNAAYWIEELHFDGLRLDATQSIHDRGVGEEHIIAEIVAAARRAAGSRAVVVIAENEPQQSHLLRAPPDGGFGCDAIWNDDLHHAAIVAATGRRDAYYSDTAGSPQELISALKWGPLFQGQFYTWQSQNRGEPALDVAPPHFVTFLHNHDQVANSPGSGRLGSATSPGRVRALSTLFLLAPGTPMLFQGEEYDATTPFYYFADHHEALAKLVRAGRLEFMGQFAAARDEAVRASSPDPSAPETFAQSTLDPAERETARGRAALARTHDLLQLRRNDPVFSRQRADRMHGAVLGPEAFLLRFFGEAPGDDRLILVNLGAALILRHASEPLLAPPRDRAWSVLFSSEDPRYGGAGTPPLESTVHPRLPAHATLVLAAKPRRADAPTPDPHDPERDPHCDPHYVASPPASAASATTGTSSAPSAPSARDPKEPPA